MHICVSRPQWVNPFSPERYSSYFKGIIFKVIIHWAFHDDVIKWKHFPRYWPFVRGIHYSPLNSPHKGQWRGALMFSLICTWTNGWVNSRHAGDLRRHGAHDDVTVMRCEIALRWMTQSLTKEKSILVQVMAWCREPLLGQYWPRSMTSLSHNGFLFVWLSAF